MSYTMNNQVYKNMKNQQISPWTFYDKNGGVLQQNNKDNKEKKVVEKPIVLHRLVNINKKQHLMRQNKLSDLLIHITKQKSTLNEKLNYLICLKVIRDHLSSQSNPVTQVKINLPKLKNELLQYPIQPKYISHHHGSYRNSQKLNVIQQLHGDILEDFSKIFISKSLGGNSQAKLSPTIKKSEFPKIKNNQSVLLPAIDIKKQFDDNKIHQTVQITKKRNWRKKNTVTSIIYDLQL